MSATMTLNFKKVGDVIVLIGAQQNDIGSSEYLHKLKKVEYSPAPHFDLDTEFNVQQLVATLIKNKNIVSAHDISEGGLAITLLESGFTSNLGFEVSAAPNKTITSPSFLKLSVMVADMSSTIPTIPMVGVGYTGPSGL